MPILMPEHLTNLRSGGAEFEPYTRRDGRLRSADGRPPVRDAQREHRCLLRYWDTLEPERKHETVALAELLPPMSGKCRIVVQLPARLESQYLERFLRLMTGQVDTSWQVVSPEWFEILILSNRLHGDPSDNTAAVARTFIEAGRHRNIHFLEHVHPVSESAPLTSARRYLADITIYRALARGMYPSPLYFALEDADLEWCDPRQLWTHVDRLDRRPWLDALRGVQDRCPWILREHDLLLLMRRSWNFTETLLTRQRFHPSCNPSYNFTWNRTVTSGWNTTVTAEAFALIRGYTPYRVLEEDVDLGERISCVRGWEHGERGFCPETGTIGRVGVRAEGSPRRWLYRVVTGREPYDPSNQYGQFFESQTKMSVRSADYASLLHAAQETARIRADNVAGFEQVLSKDWAFTLEVLPNEASAVRQWTAVMAYLGFKSGEWGINGDRVRIGSIVGLRAALDRFRTRTLSGRPGLRPQVERPRLVWRAFTDHAA